MFDCGVGGLGAVVPELPSMADVSLRPSHPSFPLPSLPLSTLPCLQLYLSPKQPPQRKLLSPPPLVYRHRERLSSLKAAVAENEAGPKWWERNASNMVDIHSTEEFIAALSEAGDKLVVVEFYGTWCGSCRALFPRLCRTAEEHPDIRFLKVNFDENKPMCKRLNVRVLPYFHFYRGADGLLESFSCSLAKFQKIKDAINTHNTARCSIGPPSGVGDIDLLGSAKPADKPTESSSR